MANREKIVVGEYYHIYNRGVDKGIIIKDKRDLGRLIKCLELFNSKEPIGSLRDIKLGDHKIKTKLVEIVSYCLNRNHFHFLLKEMSEGGISEFMKRLTGGYTWYFNSKYRRSGSLFQGTFKSVLVTSNEQLLYLSAYINLNNRVHQPSNPSGLTAGIEVSSWKEYVGESSRNICKKEIILEQFKSTKEYRDFSESALEVILESREDKDAIEMLIGRHFF
ncbi:MAG: transposase [Minisyncoccia bacterium]